MRYVAICTEAGAVERVIVVPDGGGDPVQYARNLGLAGTLVPCEKAGSAIGMQHVEGKLYPVWRQTFGAGDDPLEIGETGFPEGVEVYHAGKVWVSTISLNVWEPGVSGWREKGGETGPAPWQQPTGAHDAYPKDALVSFGGQTWRSDYAANVWQPGVFGWVIV